MAEDPTMVYEEIAGVLAATSPTTISKLFGMPSLKIGGRAYAGLRGDSMVFKLTGDAHARALALRGAHPFDPANGRPMKEWVMVPAEHVKRWLEIAIEALEYVGSNQ